jgi:hypothetical protein
VKIYSLEHRSLEEVKPFIGQCGFIPFNDYNIERAILVNNVIEELSDILYRGGSVLVAREQGKTIGLISSEVSQWDSDLFGTKISKIIHLLSSEDYVKSCIVKRKLVSDLIAECCSKLSVHLSARIYKEDLSSTHALESKSFRLMDVLVTYSFDLRNKRINEPEVSCHVRESKQDEILELAEIASECFSNSPVATDRFHADPTLPAEKSGLLYVKWVVDSCKDPSNKVLVAEIDGTPVGFNICNTNDLLDKRLGFRLGTIAITAVKPTERRRLVATSLLNASLKWFTNKVDVVETGGQVSNYAIQRAWCKVGFKIIRSQCTFHWSVLPDSL